MDSYVALVGAGIILLSVLLWSFWKKSKVFTLTAGIGIGVWIGAILSDVVTLLR